VPISLVAGLLFIHSDLAVELSRSLLNGNIGEVAKSSDRPDSEVENGSSEG
jgi:hypothetical protein